MEKLLEVEKYILHGEYPLTFTKSDKANLRRRCRNIFRIEDGVLQYKGRKAAAKEGGDLDVWRVCVRTEEEKNKILECCHAGIEGNSLAILINYSEAC